MESLAHPVNPGTKNTALKIETIIAALRRSVSLACLLLVLAPAAHASGVSFRLQFVGSELLGYYGDNLLELQRMDTLLKYTGRGGVTGIDSVVLESGYLEGGAGEYLQKGMCDRRLSSMREYLERRVEYYGYAPLPIAERPVRYPATEADPRIVTQVNITMYLRGSEPQAPYAPKKAAASDPGLSRPAVYASVKPRPRPLPERAPELPRQEKHTASREESYAVGLGSNLLYLGVLVPNLEAEFYFARRFSIRLQWMYADWELGTSPSGDANFWSIDRYGAELRFWFRGDGSFTGHALGLYGSGGQFDLKKKGRTGHTGSYIVGGLRYGYTVPLNPSRSLVMCFGLEAGYLRLDYSDYGFSNGKFYRQADKLKNYWGPTGVEVTLTWRFGRP